MPLRGQVVVITGASSGFGELIAARCVAQGARVVLAARTQAKLDTLAASFGPDRALAVQTDVALPADAARLFQATLDRFGRADVLVNNAGFGILDPLSSAAPADLQQMLDVNLFGALYCTQAFLPSMRARRSGQIVMMASVAGLLASPNMGLYSTTKHALIGLSRTLAVELTGSGVRLALICPGVAQTGFQQRADRSKFARSTRFTSVTPEAVADATVSAISRQLDGELVIPRRVLPLIWARALFPNLGRRITAWLG